ncbi:Irregular chiasm C-roughest protein [Eumeta japonica]|uniref:Irregular chiasm C-roughest protein n=1 Tax=Eumeta variegata TaxID=151549 RepID=A0A4C1SYY4_EUMVA|nr:Irregular chiasm C-roughest protein [Eumeta japonica]
MEETSNASETKQSLPVTRCTRRATSKVVAVGAGGRIQQRASKEFKRETLLQVKYAPAVRLYLKSNIAAGRIFEGDELRLGCEAEGNPSEFTYKWYLNNQMVPGNFTNELIITNLSRKYNDNTIKCEVYNSVGKSADSKILEVSYGPRFVNKPKNVEADSGTTATLNCAVDGNPTPEIIWLHHENGRIVKVGHSPNLAVDVNERTAGVYRCRASVDGFPPTETSVIVFVKGPPKIIANSTQYGIEGSRIHVECLTFSVPKPDYFLWTFDGRELKPHDQDYEFLEEALSEGLTKSTLMIREGRSNHFGTYNCTVQNPYGRDTFEIYLEPYTSTAAACMTAVVSIAVFVVLCRRRRRRQRRKTSDDVDDVKKPDVTDIGKGDCGDKCNGDRCSNLSELKLELRQIEGGCDKTYFNMNLPVALLVSMYDEYPLLTSIYHAADYSPDFGHVHDTDTGLYADSNSGFALG